MDDTQDISDILSTLNVPGEDWFRQQLYEQVSGKKVVFFGASGTGKLALRNKRSDIHVDCFSDNDPDKWNTSFEGYKVISPEELVSGISEYSVFITSHFYDDISAQLKRMGIEESDISIIYHNTERNRQYFDFLSNHKDSIKRVCSFLSDDLSKKTLKNMILARLGHYRRDTVASASIQPQYFLREFHAKDFQVFIDGGAYIGDTLEEFIGLYGGEFQNYYAFEPVKHHLISIEEILAGKPYEFTEKVRIIPKALYSEETKLCFEECSEGASHISDSGTNRIEAVALDNLEIQPPTFIKLDVEGSELKALNGMSNVIQKYRPALAVCIYHKWQDIFELPLYIKSLRPDYRLILRHHGSNRLEETVVYAT